MDVLEASNRDRDDPAAAERVSAGPALVRLLAATTVSMYGDWLTTVALLVLLYQTTGSAVAPAAYMLVRVAPRPFGSGPGGALADRMRPSRAAGVVAIVQGLLVAAIIPAAQRQTIWLIYVLVAAAQLLGAMSRPISMAVIAQLTPPRLRGRINQLYSTLLGSAVFISPAVGALLLPLVGARWLLFMDAVSFLLAGVLFISLHTVGGSDQPVRLGGMFAAGLGMVFRDRLLRLVAAGALAGGATVTAVQAVLVVAAQERFGGADRVGWCYAAVGAGGLIGAAIATWGPLRSMRRAGIMLASLLEVIALAGFAFVPIAAVGIALLALSSITATIAQIRGNVVIQSERPREVGRISGAVGTANFLGMLTGAVVAVALTDRISWIQIVVGVAAAGALLIGVCTLGPEGRVRVG